ncbi:hypothetical protein AGMMS50267_05740 [Spirochaetia bacterium]|nr:hypothetical protein AGMMS50267_05740 [Spirochaetia bacterium]
MKSVRNVSCTGPAVRRLNLAAAILLPLVFLVISGCKHSVDPAPVVSARVDIALPLDVNQPVMRVGESLKLTAAVEPATLPDTSVVWASGDPALAEIATDGTVTAKKAGTVIITAKAVIGPARGTCTLYILEAGENVTPTLVITLPAGVNQPVLRVGETVALGVTVTPGSLAGEQVTWKSGDETLATVNTAGKVTALKKGEVTITATTESLVKGILVLQILEAGEVVVPVSAVTLNKTALTLDAGETDDTLLATVAPANATVKEVDWSSSDETAAEVDADGTITAKKAGTVTITARAKGLDAGGGHPAAALTLTVNAVEVSPVPVSEITLTGQTVEVGFTGPLVSQVLPANATDKGLTWTSADGGVVSVNANTGVITAVSAGSATITATAKDGSGISGTATVTVNAAGGGTPDPVPVTSITLTGKTVDEGFTGTVAFSVLPSDATNKGLTWTSADGGVVSVNANTGVITAASAGSATITATAKDGSGVSGTCTITVTAVAPGAKVQITASEGWLETAYVKWNEFSGAASYNVYYKGGSVTSYTKIDDPLVRKYQLTGAQSYYRADVMGIAAGSYDIKVVPVIGGTAREVNASETSVTVTAHDRSGYAFAENTVPGGYKLDGTPKANARIIYVADSNKDTVTLGMRQDNASTEVQKIGLQNIIDGAKKGNESRPLIIRLIGKVGIPATTYSGDIVFENKNSTTTYTTIEGVGDDAVAYGWGIRLKGANNIEINNIGFMQTAADEGDDVGLQSKNYHIWVHNCDLFYGQAGGDADQAKGDGAMDSKGSTYVTFSYNHFWDNGKTHLVGNKENGPAGGPGLLTLHHNWYDHSDSRHPRVRVHTVHVYNNYYDGVAKYGIGATYGASVFAEGNYFKNSKNPMMISKQGTDVYNGAAGTFSGEDGGIIKAYNNTMDNSSRYAPYNASSNPVEFDAYEVTNRNDTVPSGITTKQGGKTYNNFDTAAGFYTYTADSPATAMANVKKYAGRYWGGNFAFTFTTADDSSYAVNTSLQSKLVGYTSDLVSVQNLGAATDTGSSGGGTSLPEDPDDNPDEGDVEGGGVGSPPSSDGLPNAIYAYLTGKRVWTTGTVPGSSTYNVNSIFGTVEIANDAQAAVKTLDGFSATHAIKMKSNQTITITVPEGITMTLTLYLNNGDPVKVGGTDHSGTASGDFYVYSEVVSGTVAIGKAASKEGQICFIKLEPNS